MWRDVKFQRLSYITIFMIAMLSRTQLYPASLSLTVADCSRRVADWGGDAANSVPSVAAARARVVGFAMPVIVPTGALEDD